MMIDMLSETQKKQYTEYLLFRSFYTGFEPHESVLDVLPKVNSIKIAEEIIKSKLDCLASPAILLSSGMDSASILPYVSKQTKAFTILHEGDRFSEVEIAKEYCLKYKIEHEVIMINSSDYLSSINALMKNKKMPLSPAEPIFYLASKHIASQGYTEIITGGGADTKQGGFARFRGDCSVDEIIKKYEKKYLKASKILKESVNPDYVFENYLKQVEGKLVVNSRKILAEIGVERFAFDNAISFGGCAHVAPYSEFLFEFDEERNLSEPKYMISNLFEHNYGMLPPKKIGMQKPPDALRFFLPKTQIFKSIDFRKLNFPQVFLIYSLDLWHHQEVCNEF